jgi:hypothetical protein
MRLVYLDAAYDFADAESVAAFKARPVFTRPAAASASFDAYRQYELATLYGGVDPQRLEIYLRKKVILQHDGSVKDRTPQVVRDELYAALFSNPRDYSRVRSPVLAIYPRDWYPSDIVDSKRRAAVISYEKVWAPFKAKSIARIRREIAKVEVVQVPGAHSNFFLVSREEVVRVMRRFLSEGPDTSAGSH